VAAADMDMPRQGSCALTGVAADLTTSLEYDVEGNQVLTFPL